MACFNITKYIQKKFGISSKAKNHGTKEFSVKEKKPLPPCPQPLPLSPFSARRSTAMRERRGAEPLPLPYPRVETRGSIQSEAGTSIGSIKYFSYEEIITAIDNYSSIICMSECLNSTMYMASFVGGEGASSSKILEATVRSLNPSSQDLREFLKEVYILASLQHPNLCKLLGFHADEKTESRMLVYERLWHGSLDQWLFVRSNGPPIDWNMRIKIATSAAQGLTFLHEEGPLQAMYCDISTANIQIHKYFNAKLSGYGFVGYIPKEESLSNPDAARNLSRETLKNGMLTPKSNVWSFGIILLELLTGRKNFDSRLPEEERKIIQWCRSFFATDAGLLQMMDPQLKGQFQLEAARRVAEIAQRCLQEEPSERPTMRTIAENLKMVQQELAWGMSRSNVATTSTWPTMLPLPPHHASSSNFYTGEIEIIREESTHSSSSSI